VKNQYKSDIILSMEQTKPKLAINVYVIKDNKILLGKRKKTGNGFWGLPGGHLEFGESPIEGAKRELEEETGLKSDNLIYKNTASVVLLDDNTHYVSVNFILDDFQGEPQLMEPDKFYEWAWFDLNKLPENIFIGHKKFLDNFSNSDTLIN
jgi:8-oxo-dGTP diphosphatase